MSIDTFVMLARVEQEYRIEQAAKYNFLQEVANNRRRDRPGLFSRRARAAK